MAAQIDDGALLGPNSQAAQRKAPVVTGLSPKEGIPGTQITIRGENLGVNQNDLIGELGAFPSL